MSDKKPKQREADYNPAIHTVGHVHQPLRTTYGPSDARTLEVKQEPTDGETK